MTAVRRYMKAPVDIVVIGAGHAGIEAAFAGARLGKKTVILTISLDSVGDMPCNPNIGGTGKGHRPHSIAVGAMPVFPPAFVRKRFCLGNNYQNVLLSGFLFDSPCIYGKIRLYCICIYVCVEVEYVGT